MILMVLPVAVVVFPRCSNPFEHGQRLCVDKRAWVVAVFFRVHSSRFSCAKYTCVMIRDTDLEHPCCRHALKTPRVHLASGS